MQNVSIKTENGTEHNMSTSTYARWLCLVEAFDFINKNEQKFKSLKPNIKTIAIQKYIEERYHAMLHDVKVEEGLYDLEMYSKKTVPLEYVDLSPVKESSYH